jgi:stage V sporulation protein AC
MSDYMNNGAPGNVIPRQGFVLSDDMNPDHKYNNLKNEEPIMDKQQNEREVLYNDFVKDVTPTHSLPKQMLKAFISGGLVCALGQVIINAGIRMGLEEQTAGSWCSLLLVLISVLLTGFNLFYRIAKWAGAGILVPITGFANGVASSAIEYKKEGQVFGIGCKIFTIAGPVILYGLVCSWALGLLYWIGLLFGIKIM